MKSTLPFFLALSVFFIACSAPQQSDSMTETATITTPSVTTTPKTPQVTSTPSQTPTQEYKEDLTITDIEKELEEMENILSELESLEKTNFEI